MDSDNSKIRGRWGEAHAARYLRERGYSIIGAGYRTRFGEIDIIAREGKTVVFVEVKTRKSAKWSPAGEAVDRHKRSRIISAAEQWLAENGPEQECRFDVIGIYAPTCGMLPEVEHIKNAFWVE